MIPGNSLSSSPVVRPYILPTRSRLTPTVDTSEGGVGVNDPSQGSRVQEWTARYEGGAVVLSAANTEDTTLFVRPGITELSLAFDQAMRPAVSFMEASGSWLWWYDSQRGGQVFTALDIGVVNPLVMLDDKRSSQQSESDIILAYIRDTGLYFRQQRDRFGVEYLLQANAGSVLSAMGMNSGNRIQFKIIQ